MLKLVTSSPRTSHPCTVSRERTREFQYLLSFSVLFCSASPHTEKILNTNPSLTSFFIHSSQLLLNLVARREESLPSLITHLLLPHPTRHVHTPQRLTLTRRRLPRPFPLSPGRIHGVTNAVLSRRRRRRRSSSPSPPPPRRVRLAARTQLLGDEFE